MAGAAAIWLAGQGPATLLASTNPVHSLTSLLGQECLVTRRRRRRWTTSGPTRSTPRRPSSVSKEEIREKIQWFLKFADISTKADDLVESATMNPAFEESAMFENMVDLMFKNEYDVYVFDTAPTANAAVCSACRRSIAVGQQDAQKPRGGAHPARNAFLHQEEGSRSVDGLSATFRDRMETGAQLLTDNEKTAFFFVTLPEALPIAVITRFIGWFQDFGIPVGGVIVNMLLDKAALGQDVPEFVRNRVQMQEEYMKSIWEKFDGSVRALVPLFDQGSTWLRDASRSGAKIDDLILTRFETRGCLLTISVALGRVLSRQEVSRTLIAF